MMSQNHSSFSYEDWNFNVQKDKESTGRVVVNREYNVNNSFTLEASFFGSDIGKYKNWHFTPTQLREVGRAFCIALNEADSSEITKEIQLKLEESGTLNNEVTGS